MAHLRHKVLFDAVWSCQPLTGLVLQVKETVRDVKLLHNEQFFAAAQKKYVYIYDKRGLEVHCLKVCAAHNCSVRVCYNFPNVAKSTVRDLIHTMVTVFWLCTCQFTCQFTAPQLGPLAAAKG